MKPLATIERVREALDYNPETGVFTWKFREEVSPKVKTWNKRFAGKKTGCKTNPGGFMCIQISLDDKLYRAHRLAWVYVYGYWPKKEIDHINLDACDNRICNLREADRSQNECNKKPRADNKLGVKGVCFDKTRNLFIVQLKCKGLFLRKRMPTLESAQALYAEWAHKYHGDYGRTS